MLYITTWRWGDRYGDHYVGRLQAGVARHLRQPYEFRVLHPEPEDAYLTEIPGCMARLRAFDPAWQQRQGFADGDRIVSLDLDLIVTGPLDDVFDRPEPFVVLAGANASNPGRANGSVWMLRPGYRPDVWSDFSLSAVKAAPHWTFPDDQSWFDFKLKGSAEWVAGPESGVLAFHKPGWPRGNALPKNARIVAFPGWRDPAGFRHLDWVAEHWVA